MAKTFTLTASIVAAATALVVSSACTKKEPQDTSFFNRTISLTLQKTRVTTLCGVKPPLLISTTPATRSTRSSAKRQAA